MKRITGFVFTLLVSNFLFASDCLPPPSSVESLVDWGVENSDVVFRGRLIDIKYSKKSDEHGWGVYSVEYSFEVLEIKKTENKFFGEIHIQDTIACDNCDVEASSLFDPLFVGGEFLVFANKFSDGLRFNRCMSVKVY